ncbi:MAG: MFS transporter [Ignavibacteriales bacterium]|nr:MFS transporter [Ignavibacteriales bacterium]
MELLERAAYYGFFIIITLYLTNIIGFTDIETGIIAGIFGALIYFFPPFAGAISDKIGFKNGLILAFVFLTVGYFFLGIFHSKFLVVVFLLIVVVGASFIKPLITGTVAKTTNAENKARGFSLFYWIVNIGAFGGKTVVPSIRQGIGLEYVNFFSAGMSFIALLFAIFIFKIDENRIEKSKSFSEILKSLKAILMTPRLILLILIVSGFWLIQHQLYATMPKYVIRLLGEQAKPEWLANVNPLVVVLFVVFITQLFKKYKAVSVMLIGMIIMPFSALAMASSQTLESITGNSINILGLFTMHPLTVMMIIGIGIQGIAECFISPRFLEYFALQAPEGEEGTYMGFSHLHSFFSYLIGFFLSGFLLDAYCPDPSTLPIGISEADKMAIYANAHVLWYYFVGIASIATIALFIFRYVTNKIDSSTENAAVN